MCYEYFRISQIGTGDAAKVRIVEAFTKCGVKFKFCIGQNNKVSWTQLMGPDKEKILRRLDLPALFGPNHAARGDEIRALWDEFLELYDQFHSVDDDVNGEPRWNHVKFREKALAFAKHFTKAPRDGVAREHDIEAMYSSSDVTPYLHAMVWHWPQLMQRHGLPIASFSCSGLEKKNHMRASLCLIVWMRRDLCELIFFLPVLMRRPIWVFPLDVSQRRHRRVQARARRVEAVDAQGLAPSLVPGGQGCLPDARWVAGSTGHRSAAGHARVADGRLAKQKSFKIQI